MIDIVTKINNMMFEGAPLWDVIDACSVIDIGSCFNPIFEPPLDFLEALEIASERVRAFLDVVLSRGKEAQEHKQSARRRGHDMEH